METSTGGIWEISAGTYRLTVAICAVLITLFCLVGILLLNGIKVAEERQACAAQRASWSINTFRPISEHLNCDELLNMKL